MRRLRQRRGEAPARPTRGSGGQRQFAQPFGVGGTGASRNGGIPAGQPCGPWIPGPSARSRG